MVKDDELYINYDLPSGYDVRDALGEGAESLKDRIGNLQHFLGLIIPVPDAWAILGDNQTVAGMDSEECQDYAKLKLAWRKALKWTPGLDAALSVMLASVTSTKMVGDQLWVKIVAPPATGKSTLCEALSIAKDHILAKSTIRGFHSGWVDKNGEDHSLISKLKDKTLIIKDGDTLLQSPNLAQILSEGRDIYDTVSRTSYRNTASRDYENLRMTWILCGTSALRQIDSSELGQRFLDCIIMDEIDDELEDEILLKSGYRAERNLNLEADDSPETNQDPAMINAMQLTGGYVDYLKENAQSLLEATTTPDKVFKDCRDLAKFVSYMRARPSTQPDEIGDRELATRLLSQLIRLAKCLAVVMNRKTVDESIMKVVRKVARDTCKGRTLEIIDNLYEKGVTIGTLATKMNRSQSEISHLIRFLYKIKAIESFKEERKGTRDGVKRWRPVDRIVRLYEKVVLEKDEDEEEEEDQIREKG